jgi:hypothetical protein
MGYPGAGAMNVLDQPWMQDRINKLAELPGLDTLSQLSRAAQHSENTTSPTLAPSSSPKKNQAMASSPFDWRHEAVARSLCVASGYDPDLKVVDVRTAKAGPFGSIAASAVQPAWHCYLPMSEGIVGALDTPS